MAKAALATRETTGAQNFSLLRHYAVAICASAVIAVCARLILPLPFTPVPLTLANFAVLLVGLSLGSKRGFVAAALYLGWGAVGLPVFSPAGPGGVAQLLGPTAGYLWAFPLMAFVAGWIAERGARSFARNLAAGIAADVLLFAGGTAWLAVFTHSWQHALVFGLYPFFAAEIMKLMVAAALARRLQGNF
jgi:biotin transport system substrate-specific component